MGLLVAGSISAGVQAGLAPEHLREWPPLGAAFIAAALVAFTAVTALAVHPAGVWASRGLGLILAGLIVAYASTRLVALPPLDPTREPLDTIGVYTNAVEAAGLILAFRLSRRVQPHRRLPLAVSPGGTR